MFTTQLAHRQAQMGHEVKVYALYSGEATFEYPVETIGMASKRLWDKKGLRRLQEAVEKFEPHVIQCNAADTLKYGALLKGRLRETHPVFVYRNASMVSLYMNSGVKRWVNQRWVNKMDGVASVSHMSANDFCQVYTYASKRVKVLPVGIDPNTKEPGLELNLPPNFMVHVGGFTFEKNHEALLSIYKQVLSQKPDIKLVLVGDGILKPEIEEKAKQMGLAGQVLFLGYQKAVLSIMKQARLLVLPSRIEGLPGVILEAMLMKVPVVANDVGGVSEVVSHRKTGMLIDMEQPEAFAAACCEVLDNAELTNPMIAKAYDQVIADFDNEVIADRFINFYEELLA